jgi:hypothetical protein
MTLQGSNGQSGRVEAFASLRVSGDCGAETLSEGTEILFEEGPDGTGITTLRFPQSLHETLADGGRLATPSARITHYTYLGVPDPTTGGTIGGTTLPTADNTEVGTDYLVTSGGDVVEEPPGDDVVKEEKKLTRKQCMKIKNKKKRKRCLKKLKAQNQPPPVADSCPAYEPGEQGAEAETAIVTDEHTEEAPLEVPLAAAPGIGVGGTAETEALIGHVFQNVQVDASAPETGLYVRLEMPYPSDHDLYVNNPDGSTAARAAGFNPEPAVYDDTEAGGHTEAEAEQIDGLRTSDCQGYTVDVATATGEGVDVVLKFWVGEATYDPAASGGARAALELMQGTLG